jgi:sulfide:quinone oxidoreductase
VVTLEDDQVIEYDYLVLCPGLVSDPSPIPGLADYAIDVTKRESFPLIRDALHNTKPDSTILITIAKIPYICPPFPFELAFLVDEILATVGVREGCEIIVTCPVPWPFGGPGAERLFKAAMDAKEIDYRPECTLVAIRREGDKNVASFAEDEPDVVADLALAVYPHRAPDFLVEANMVNPKLLVPVDVCTNRVKKGIPEGERNVFCVGDACAAMMPGMKAMIPKAGEFAWQGGVSVGELIKGKIRSPSSEDVLPVSRKARCIADCGYGNGIIVKPDFSNVIADPGVKRPDMFVTAIEGGSLEKADFVNLYLALFAGDTEDATPAKRFKTSSGPRGDPNWASFTKHFRIACGSRSQTLCRAPGTSGYCSAPGSPGER